MNILVVSGFWPTKSNTISGIFVAQQVAALVRAGCKVTVMVGTTLFRPSSPICSLAELGLDSSKVTLVEVPLLRLPERLSSLPGALWLNTTLAGAMLARAVRWQMTRAALAFAGCIAHGKRPMGLAMPAWRKYVTGGATIVMHGFDPFFKDNSNRRRARSFFDAAGHTCDAVVLVGHPLHAYAISLGFPTDKLRVVANGTDLPSIEEVSDSQRALNEARRIVSVSNLVDWKGIDDNLRALSAVAKRMPHLEWEYRIVGDGVERQRLECLAMNLEIADRVRFLGRIPYAETMREIAEADIFSLPSWGEAFGIVYLEAMSRMRPVIGCLEKGAADVVTDGHEGLLVPPRDIDSLSRALERLIGNPALSQHLGRQARITAEVYSWDHNARRMLELIGIDTERAQ
jgi:glycosyltransferase involved in cell wall biosynthesis